MQKATFLTWTYPLQRQHIRKMTIFQFPRASVPYIGNWFSHHLNLLCNTND